MGSLIRYNKPGKEVLAMTPLVTHIIRECHRLRSHIYHLQQEIDRGPRVIRSRQEELEQERHAYEQHFETIKRLKLKQREDEGSLKQTEARLARLEEQLLSITSAKEYQAKLSEIAQAKEKKSMLEDAILTTIMELEEKMAATPKVEKRWSQVQSDFVAFQREAEERYARLQQDLQWSQQELQRWEDQIPEDLRERYEKLVRAMGPDAFAAVKNRYCQGCHTQISEQCILDLRNGTFLRCFNCGRMLYVEDN
jgi:predicted  nucleic acid-binding Zn-ribbon protein